MPSGAGVNDSPPTEGRVCPPRPAGLAGWLPTPLEVGLLATFGVLTRHLSSCDLWWHLVAGRTYVETGSIPAANRLSLVSDGAAWVNPSWLFDTVAWTVVRHGGLGLLVALKGLIACATLWLIVRLAWESGGRSRAALTVALVIGIVSLRSQFWNARPQMVTPLFAALFLLILRRFEMGRDDRLSVLPALTLLWANTHAGYALGLVWILFVLLGQCWVALSDPAARGRCRRVATVLGVCALASCVNPYGPKLALYPLFHAGNVALRGRITEWGPTILRDEPLILAVILAWAVAPLLAPRKPFAPSEPLLVLSGLYMACDAARHHFVLGPILGPSTAACVDSRPGGDPDDTARHRFPRSWLAWVLLAAWTLSFAGVREVRGLPGFYPERIVSELRLHPPPGNGYNQFELGGYLMYHVPAGPRPFIDGRVDMHIASGGFDDYLAVWDTRPGFERILDRYGVRWALVEDTAPLVAALTARGWTVRIEDGRWRLLVRGEAGR